MTDTYLWPVWLANTDKVGSEAPHRVLGDVCGELGTGTPKQEHPNSCVAGPQPRGSSPVEDVDWLSDQVVLCPPAFKQDHLEGAAAATPDQGDCTWHASTHSPTTLSSELSLHWAHIKKCICNVVQLWSLLKELIIIIIWFILNQPSVLLLNGIAKLSK